MPTEATSKGLLLATMEPPANIEEEFQDWYAALQPQVEELRLKY